MDDETLALTLARIAMEYVRLERIPTPTDASRQSELVRTMRKSRMVALTWAMDAIVEEALPLATNVQCFRLVQRALEAARQGS